MKYLAIVLLLCSCTKAPSREPAGMGADKVVHFGGSAALTTGLYLTMTAFTGREHELRMPSLISACLFGAAYGVALEVMDANGGRLDRGDLAANALGIVTAGALIYLLDVRSVKPAPGGIAIEF